MKNFDKLSGAVLFSAAAFAAGAVFLSGTALYSPKAEACRDCPFPMRLSAGRWLMPSGHALLTVDEKSAGPGKIESSIRLLDAATGGVLAEGTVVHSRGKKRVHAVLLDSNGELMNVELHYQDPDRKKLRVRMSCRSCNVQKSYMN